MSQTFKSLVFIVPFLSFFSQTSISQELMLDSISGVWYNSNKLNTSDFNYNGHLELDLKKDRIALNRLNEEMTFFVVFKADSINEHILIDLDYGNEKLLITTKGVFLNGRIKQQFENYESGQIISYSFSDTKVGLCAKNKISIPSLEEIDNEFFVFEVIAIPQYLSNLEIRKMETYLSFKYGISLEEEENYISSENDTIWNSKRYEHFKKDITGIGYNLLPGFNQFFGQNSKKNDLRIAYKTKDSTYKFDKNQKYIIWGNNGKNLDFSIKESDVMLSERIWRIKVVDSSKDVQPLEYVNIDLDTDKLKIRKEKDELLYLLYKKSLNDSTFKFYPGVFTDSSIVGFNDVELQKEGFFQIAKTDHLDLVLNERAKCDQLSEYEISIEGGIAPYSIDLINIMTGSNLVKSIDVTPSTLDFEEEGTYVINITDQVGQKLQDTLTVKPSYLYFELQEQIQLSYTNEIFLKPYFPYGLQQSNEGNLNIEWYYEDIFLAGNLQITPRLAGKYRIVVSTSDCKCEKTVSVTEDFHSNLSNDQDDVSLAPNPINAGESFKLIFKFLETRKAQIRMTDSKGTLLFDKNFMAEFNSVFTRQITNSGVYLIQVKSDAFLKNLKLIVK